MYSEEDWIQYQSKTVSYHNCPWCGKSHDDSYGNQEQPVFYQDKAYCSACYQQLQNNIML